MIGLLVRKELLGHLLTLRLAVAFGVTVALVALVTFIGGLDFSVRMEEYRSRRQEVDQGLGRATTWGEVRPSVVLPPQPLSLFAVGVESWVGNHVFVSMSTKLETPGLRATLTSDFMKTLVQVDFVTVVAVVLSFLAVALGFDGISGERESGTLRQLLAQPVSRAQVVVGKLLGGCLALWLPLAVACTLATLIAAGNPDVTLSRDDWIRLALLFPLSCLFLAQVYALSLMVSCWVERSATSLILCLFGWLVGGVVFLNMAPFAGEFGMRETPWQIYVNEAVKAEEAYEADLASWEARNPSPGPAYTEGLRVDDVLRFARPEGYEWLARRSRYEVERSIELGDHIYDLRWNTVHRERAEQASFADRWAVLSPLENYRMMAYRLARTTIDDKLYLGQASHRYREALIQYLRGTDAFGRRWVTDDPPHQEPMIADPAAVTPQMLQPGSDFMRERLAWARAQSQRIEATGGRALDLVDMPRFDPGGGYRRLGASLLPMLPGLTVAVASLALAVLLTVVRFLRYEPHR